MHPTCIRHPFHAKGLEVRGEAARNHGNLVIHEYKKVRVVFSLPGGSSVIERDVVQAMINGTFQARLVSSEDEKN